MPSLDGSTRTREVDVLLTGSFGGYPVRIAIECKNYANRIGVNLIDEFKGKLEDIGIPIQHGVFVSVNGFTRDSRRRASSIGMRLLSLTGLTSDRLSREIADAIQSVIFVLAELRRISVRSKLADFRSSDFPLIQDSSGTAIGFIWDLAWAKWRDGDVPRELGEYILPIALPNGWQWSRADEIVSDSAEVTIRVSGLVVNFRGNAEQYALVDAQSGIIERLKIRASFENGHGSNPVSIVHSESELTELLSVSSRSRLFVDRIPLPRIAIPGMYWPPSDRALKAYAFETHQLIRRGMDLSRIPEVISLEGIEGTDLSTIWDPISAGHPAYSDPTWPYYKHGRN